MSPQCENKNRNHSKVGADADYVVVHALERNVSERRAAQHRSALRGFLPEDVF